MTIKNSPAGLPAVVGEATTKSKGMIKKLKNNIIQPLGQKSDLV